MKDVGYLLANPKSRKTGVCFVGIDGHGGSGKSTLADFLAKQLNAAVIHTDDFAGLDSPSGWQKVLISHVFEPIKSGHRTLSYQPLGGWPEHRRQAVSRQIVTDIMILEGVTSLRREFRPYIDVAFFVHTPRNICLSRGLARDASCQIGEMELRSRWDSWLLEEDRYFARDTPKAYADFVVDGTIPFESQLSFAKCP